MSSEERFWPRRMRWRLRGGLQWPAFVLFTLLDAVVIAELPPAVIEEPNLIVGVLAATFGNLVLIGAVAPFLARRMARRATDIERELLQDRIAAIALAIGLVACLVSGLANRPVIVSETEATEEVGRELRAYVAALGLRGAAPQPRDREHDPPERGLLPDLHRARRPPPLLLPVHRHRQGAHRGARATRAPSPTPGYAAPDPTRGR